MYISSETCSHMKLIKNLCSLNFNSNPVKHRLHCFLWVNKKEPVLKDVVVKVDHSLLMKGGVYYIQHNCDLRPSCKSRAPLCHLNTRSLSQICKGPLHFKIHIISLISCQNTWTEYPQFSNTSACRMLRESLWNNLSTTRECYYLYFGGI